MKRIFNNHLLVLATVFGLALLAEGILDPIMPLYLTSVGFGPETLGLMLSVVWIGMIISEGFWGWVADKVSPKIPLSVGTFVSGFFVFSFLLARNVPAIFTILLFWGITRSAIFGPIRGYIGTNVPSSNKATLMAISQGITMAAMGFGMIPSGFLVDAWGYHWSFCISFGISTLAGIILITGLKALSRLKNKLPVAYPRPTAELLFHDKLNSNRAITLQFVVSGLLHLGYGISITFLPLLATQVVGTTTGAVGILFAIASLSAASLVIPMGMLADRKGKRIFMILGLLVSASSLTGIAFTTTFSWLVVFFITFELGIAMFNPAALALLSDKVLLRRQSTVMGFYGAIENSGIFAGSAMAGFVWSALGSQITFLIGATACGLGAIISLIFVREKTSKSHNSGILAP